MQNYRSGGQRWIHDSPLKRDETGSDGKVLVKLQVCNVYDARLSTSPLARFEFPLSVEEGDSLPPRLFTSSALTSLGERIHFPSAPLMDFKNDRAPNLFFNKESNSNQATLLRIRQFLSKTFILKNLLRTIHNITIIISSTRKRKEENNTRHWNNSSISLTSPTRDQ